jgi:nucleoside-diphosphate-sugar epimerase
MRVLVTGGAGYVGCVLVEELVSRGHTVQVVDPAMHVDGELQSHLQSIGVGLARQRAETFVLFEEWDCFVNLAAVAGAWPCKLVPKYAYETNALLPRRIQLQLSSRDQSFLHVSTTAIFGDIGGQFIEYIQAVDNRETLYTHSKQVGERRLLPSRNTMIVRLPTLYGLSPGMRPGLLIHDMIRGAVLDGAVTIYGNLDALRPLAHVADACGHLVDVMEGEWWGTYQGAAENMTKTNIAEQIAGVLGVPIVKRDASDLLHQDHRAGIRPGFRQKLINHITSIARHYGWPG